MTVTDSTEAPIPAVIPEAKTKPKAPSGYALNIEMFASRYTLGKRTTYSLDLTPAEIDGLVATPDPEVVLPGNRRVMPAHAAAFAKYVRTRENWISTGLLLRAPKSFKFEQTAEIAGIQFGTVSFPRRSAVDLHVIDGQHRILGWHMALQGIARDMDSARNALASARKLEKDGKPEKEIRKHLADLQAQLSRLETERVSVQVIVEADPAEYKQLFADTNGQAKGIQSSLRIQFDSTKVVNRALNLVLEHPLLKGRVNLEADRASGKSPYLMGAKHVAEVIRASNVGIDGRINPKRETLLKEKDLARMTGQFLDILTESFPVMKAISLGQLTAEQLRQTSLLGSVIFVRTLAGAYWDLLENHAFSPAMIGEYFSKLARHTNGAIGENSIWVRHAGEMFTVGGMAPHSRRQDIYALAFAMTAWAIDKADFVDAEPVAAVEADVENKLEL